MAELNKNNMISYIQSSLERDIRQALTDELYKREMDKLGVMVMETIKPMVEKITIEGINHINDMAKLSDDLNVYVKWNNESD